MAEEKKVAQILRLWVPVAAIALVVAVYLLFYGITATESQGSTSVGLANAAGFAAVVIGLVVAGLIFRRGAPEEKTSDSRNP